MSEILTKEAIFAANDLRKEIVDVPEWGGAVYVRVMTGTERDEFEEFLLKGKASGMRAELAVRTLADENGARLFSAADIQKLGEKSAAALDRVFAVAQRINGFTDKDVEELEGN